MADRTCKVPDCNRDASGKRGGGRGWCPTHYMRWRRHGDPERGGDVIRQHATGIPCSIATCIKPSVGRGYCENHYRRLRRWGEPLAGRPTPCGPVALRFWSKVIKTDTCWLWTDAPNNSGYGTFSVGAVPVGAHRMSWLLDGRDLDADMQLDHLCRVRLCVRPTHLEQVTAAENLARARAANAA